MTEANDVSGFASVALPHFDAAYNLARWLMRDRSAAEDVVQEAMLRALKYFSSYRGTNARAWLLQIVPHTPSPRAKRRRAPKQVRSLQLHK